MAPDPWSSLMTGGAKRGAPNPWLLEEPEETRGLGFDEIRQQQQKIIQEQDAGLDALSSIISRQKQMGQEIGNELDEQNEIIDDLANLVENTDEKLRTETRRVNLVDRKSTSCDRADGAGEQWSCVFQATSSDPEVPLCLHHVTPRTRSLQRKSCVMLPGRPGLCSCCGQLSVVSRLKNKNQAVSLRAIKLERCIEVKYHCKASPPNLFFFSP
ncbi:syntaxin-8 isoform X7 [Bos indicus x Bos taurus]|uniref:syntaxin-8 isoform X7 n=1 Tax=Bos indicus x Bos taurus TaxID=30522 RepID=UPI000F7D284A|nr:syntaxin-8 isoform X7 [Bos indicus x Bos taurus]